MVQPNAAGIGMLANRRQRFEQCSTEGSEENFEQKAAKETKANERLGFRDVIRWGATIRHPIVLVVLEV
jgi:hypothetical protein